MKPQTDHHRIHALARTCANVLVIAGAIGCAIIAGYAIFRATSASDGQTSLFVDGHVTYLAAILAIVGMVACLLAFKIPQEARINLVLSGFSVMIGVYVIEIALAFKAGYGLVEDGRKHARYARAAGVPFDTRTRLEVINDFKQQGIEVQPDVSPRLLLGIHGPETPADFLLPLSSISRTHIILCNEYGEYSIFRSDEHGFNNPPGIFAQHQIEIALIGDSFTQGACVKPDDTIGSVLRVRRKSVINLGKSDTGPLLQLATLIEYARPVSPAIVLWLYYEENDLRDLEEEQQSPVLVQYLDSDFSQNLLARQPEIDAMLAEYITRKTEELPQLQRQQFMISVVKVAKLWHVRNLIGLSRQLVYPEPSDLFASILATARDATAAWGGQLYFVYLPTWERYVTTADQDAFLHRQQVLALVRQLGIPVIDIHPHFQQHPDPLALFPFRVFGHYTPEGYRLVAHAILDFFERQLLEFDADAAGMINAIQ